MGTPEFAVPSLEALIKDGHEIVGVITKPDKPQGRKMIMTPPAIKICAQKHNLQIFQPEKLKTEESINLIKNLNPELIVVVAYGKILPKQILEIPQHGCVNVHGSLLPKYRGAAPIQWSIINGDVTTGVTTMLMDEGLDSGDILLQSEVYINDIDTTETLKEKLSVVGANLLIKTINQLENGTLTPIKQNESKVTLSPPLDKINGNIDWSKTAKEIHDLIRGSNPWPIAYTLLKGNLFKIYRSKVSKYRGDNPGQIINTNPLTISCGNQTALELIEVQIAGKKRMPAADFARGYRLSNGMILGQ